MISMLNSPLLNPLTFQEELGAVVVTETTPTTRRFDIKLKNERTLVRRGEVIEVPSNSGEILIGMVREIQKMNPYFTSALSSGNYSETDQIQTLFPVEEWASTFAAVDSLGVFNGSQISRVQFPADPGNKVFRARQDILTALYGLSSPTTGIHLGEIVNTNTPLRIDLTKLVRKHFAILAISGAGKSYTVTVLLEEIMKRSPLIGRLPVIIIDPHGEYTSLADYKEFQSECKVYSSRDFSIPISSINAWQLREFSPDITHVQVRELERIILDLKSSNRLKNFSDILLEAEISQRLSSRTRDSILGWLEGLNRFDLYGPNENPSVKELIRPGRISVLDMSDVHSLRKKQIMTAYLARRAFELRRDHLGSPFLLVIEEAHQFCPEQETAISRPIIETIAREGRKFFASLCLVSQRPVRLSGTALSQCNTHIIMRIRNPYDLDYISRLSEGIDKDTLKILPELEVGEAIVTGEAVRYPVLTRIRSTAVSGGKFQHSLEEELSEFEDY